MSDFPPIGNGLSINGDKLTVNPNFITAGSGISVTWNGQVYTVSATGGGGSGTVTNIATGTGLTGGPITTTGTLSLAPIANNTLLANTSGTSAAPASTTLTAGAWMDVAMSAGAITVSRRAPNVLNYVDGTLYYTSSTTQTMMGLGILFTPTRTGTVLVCGAFQCGNNTVSGGIAVGFSYGTGTAPANGAANTGTQFTSNNGTSVGAAGQNLSLSNFGLATGLTVGTQYWFDVTWSVQFGGGQAVCSNKTIVFVEL